MTRLTEIQSALLAGSPLPTSAADRVRVDQANDDDEYPHIVLHRASVTHLRGIGSTLHAIKEIMHVECWGEDRVSAITLSEQAIDALLAAGFANDEGGPDGVEPNLDVRCVDVFLTVWTTPAIADEITTEP